MRSSFHLIASLASLLAALASGAPADGPIADTAAGKVRGLALPAPGGAVFKGIPFAQPPVGDLRWKPPVAARPWTGVREAVEYGAPCAQVSAEWNAKTAAAGSEDCLTLNVWTPQWPARGAKPVMVWIHGGANMGGSARGAGGIEPAFDGAKLASQGVVVVTVQYRLGIFGFFAHPELTAESAQHASGNYGLMDLAASLQWVKANIARFGGDPRNVTIFGQSAGAMDVGYLMASPLGRGLFQRAIAQSGTVLIGGHPTLTLTQAEEAGRGLAAKMNAPAAGGLAYMRKLSTAEVLKASPPYGGGGPLRPAPDVDGYFLTKSPAEVFETGGQAAVPLMIGNNGREWNFTGQPEALRKGIAGAFGPLTEQALKLYGMEGGAPVESYPPYGNAGSQFSTDTSFRCPSVLIAGQHSRHAPTYQYEFTVGPVEKGTPHSGELQYVFGVRGVQETADPDAVQTQRVQGYWVNFAKSGDPNGSGLPKWPKYESTKREYLELSNEGPVVKSDLRGKVCALFGEAVRQRTGRP
ncbi:carboxylesterase/lipase family protein [Paludibaculum fermentans]|uniref:Carboxylic ester hydrolase n=1 Tax=Paludibaculum fermentans TaxID=1473598 RepID=A0A7S7NQV2_PALFE|nr:carboxylesterase family protein [Paludibaculum fermentans]QOY88145.1 carboxylesterase family protein [Paludibaculum fermentans]